MSHTRTGAGLDAERLRGQARDDADQLSRQAPAGAVGARMFGAITVAVTKYPTTPASVFGVREVQLTGDLVEGGTYTETVIGPVIMAFNRGTAVPPLGARVTVLFVPYRHTINYGGTCSAAAVGSNPPTSGGTSGTGSSGMSSGTSSGGSATSSGSPANASPAAARAAIGGRLGPPSTGGTTVRIGPTRVTLGRSRPPGVSPGGGLGTGTGGTGT